MNCKRTALSAVLAAGLAVAPFSAAKAEPPYFAFPPFWPFITIGAIIEPVAAGATAPFRPACQPCYYGPPPYYYGPPPAYSYPPTGNYAPGYYQPAYSAPGYYSGPYYGPR